MKPSTETFEATTIDDPAPTKPRSRRTRAVMAWLLAGMLAVAGVEDPAPLAFREERERWRAYGPSPEDLERRLRGMPRQRRPTGSEREQKNAAKWARRAAKAVGKGARLSDPAPPRDPEL